MTGEVADAEESGAEREKVVVTLGLRERRRVAGGEETAWGSGGKEVRKEGAVASARDDALRRLKIGRLVSMPKVRILGGEVENESKQDVPCWAGDRIAMEV
jgi:hypothetical protein